MNDIIRKIQIVKEKTRWHMTIPIEQKENTPYPNEQFNELHVSTTYQKDGNRGYYIHIQPTRFKDGKRSYTPIGLKMCWDQAARYNQKDAIRSFTDAIDSDLIERYLDSIGYRPISKS